MIKSYKDQLEELAESRGISLKDAFAAAGFPSSTYYRFKLSEGVRLETANQVASAIQKSADADTE